MYERWKDDGYRQHMSEKHSGRWKDPSFREKVISAIKESKSTPEEKARLAKRNSETWVKMTPEKRANSIARMNDARKAKRELKDQQKVDVVLEQDSVKEDTRSDSARKTWNDPEVRKKRCDSMKEFWRLRKLKQEKGVIP